jgi:hypothetical protein
MTKTTKPATATRTQKPAKATPAAKATPVAKAKPEADPKQILAGLRSGDRYTTQRLQIVAEAGMVPPAPDFSAETHKRFRNKLAIIQKAVEAKDMKALAAIQINPVSSSPRAMLRYRDAALVALRVQAENGKAPKPRAKKQPAPAEAPATETPSATA